MLKVLVSRSGGRRGDLRKVGAWARQVLRAEGIEGELSIVLADDAGIQQLNRDWRSKDQPTDVLSFPQDGAEGPLLGDIVISVQTAARQAAELGHDLDRELQVLVVHGICHLVGHDHHAPDEAQAMREAETRMLGALGADGHGLIERAGQG